MGVNIEIPSDLKNKASKDEAKIIKFIIKDNKLNGEFGEYGVSGKVYLIGHYLEGFPTGKWTYFYPSGKKQKEIEYTPRSNKWRTIKYYENGNREKQFMYFRNDGRWYANSLFKLV